MAFGVSQCKLPRLEVHGRDATNCTPFVQRIDCAANAQSRVRNPQVKCLRSLTKRRRLDARSTVETFHISPTTCKTDIRQASRTTNMPTPYIFPSLQALIESLQSSRTTAVANSFFAAESTSLQDVVREGVAGNTFRAFRNLPVRPSVAFREWTVVYIQQSFNQILQAPTPQSYSGYIHDASIALCRYWQQATNSEMGYGRAAKLLNLVLKKLACLSSLSAQQRQRLIELQHVPLDSYTIVGLRDIEPDLAIPRSATMRHIQSPQQYIEFQCRISAIAAQAGVPAIYYDILAWDIAH